MKAPPANHDESAAVAAYQARLQAAAILKRRRRKWMFGIVAALVASVVATVAIMNALNQSRVEMRITFVEGTVTVTEAGGKTRPVALGEPITETMAVLTAAGAETDIGIAGYGGIKLDEDGGLIPP